MKGMRDINTGGKKWKGEKKFRKEMFITWKKSLALQIIFFCFGLFIIQFFSVFFCLFSIFYFSCSFSSYFFVLLCPFYSCNVFSSLIWILIFQNLKENENMIFFFCCVFSSDFFDSQILQMNPIHFETKNQKNNFSSFSCLFYLIRLSFLLLD